MRDIKTVEQEYWKELQRVGKFNGGKLHKLRKELKTIHFNTKTNEHTKTN